MELLNPWAAFLALSLLPIVAFFFLKTRLRDHAVTTSLFWDELIAERRFRAFGNRFRYPLALFLCVLFVALIVAAAVDPIFSSQKNMTKTVIVFDNSASMNSLEPQGKTRFELAKAELLSFISRIESGHTTAIITAAGEPQIAVAFTDHRPTLREKAQQLRQTDAAASLEKALELAKILTRNETDSRILIFTDGCDPETQSLALDQAVTIIQFGSSCENLAVTRLQVRRSMSEAIGYDVFAELANYSDKKLSARLTLELQFENDVTVIDIVPVTLEPGATEIVIASGHAEQGGIVRATLTLEEEENEHFRDALQSDNVAYAVLPEKMKQKILLCGEEDYFLRKALQAQLNVELTAVETCPETLEVDTILVIHGPVPQRLPAGKIFEIHPTNSCDRFTLGPVLEPSTLVAMKEDSPLLKSLRLDEIMVSGARKLEFSSQNFPEVLLATPKNDPVLLRWKDVTENSVPRDLVVFAADLQQGDFPLRTAFPILLSNVIASFRGDGGEMRSEAVAGEPFHWTPPDHLLSDENQLKRVRLRRPDGSEQHPAPQIQGDTLVFTPEQSGVWEIVSEEGRPLDCFSCSIGVPSESDLRKDSNLGQGKGLSSAVFAVVARPMRFWLLLLAVGLIVFEWFLYHRRWVE